MEFVKTIEELNACVESIEKGTGRFVGAPMAVISNYYRENQESFVKSFDFDFDAAVPAVGRVDVSAWDVDEKNLTAHSQAVTLSVRRDDEGAIAIRVERVEAALVHEGYYYRVHSVKPNKHLLSLLGATDNPHARYVDDKHPNYFNKLSARALDAWTAYRQTQEAEARRVVAAVADERAAIEQLITDSGVEARQLIDGMRLTAGPIEVDIKFNAGGATVRYEVAWSLRTGGKDVLADVLRLAHHAEPTREEEPKRETPQRNNPAFRAFKALTLSDDNASFGEAATKILQAVRERAEGFVTDVAARALASGKLSNKQRWCVAYAYARLPQA